MVLDDYDGQMSPGDECGQNVLTFVLQLRKNPAKTSTRKLTRPGIEPGPAAWEVTMLPLDHSGGHLEVGTVMFLNMRDSVKIILLHVYYLTFLR